MVKIGSPPYERSSSGDKTEIYGSRIHRSSLFNLLSPRDRQVPDHDTIFYDRRLRTIEERIESFTKNLEISQKLRGNAGITMAPPSEPGPRKEPEIRDLTDQVYREIEKRIRMEREWRGL